MLLETLTDDADAGDGENLLDEVGCCGWWCSELRLRFDGGGDSAPSLFTTCCESLLLVQGNELEVWKQWK